MLLRTLLCALVVMIPASSASGQEEVPPAPAAPGEEEKAARAPAAPAFDPDGSDPEAIELVHKMWDAMGGRDAYDKIGVLKFNFVVQVRDRFTTVRSYTWDRENARARLDMPTARGDLVVLVDLGTELGLALENGQPVAEGDNAPVVRYASDLWRGDSDWLVAPWRLMDPGVHLHMAGVVRRNDAQESGDDAEVEAADYPRIRVTFDENAEADSSDVGWLVVDPDTGMPREWSYKKVDMRADQEPLAFAFEQWEERNGVLFSLEKRGLNNPQRILLQEVAAPASLDETVFEALAF